MREKYEIEFLAAKLRSSGVQDTYPIIASTGTHLHPSQLDDLLYFAAELTSQGREENFARLPIALELSMQFNNEIIEYRKYVLYAIQFNMSVDSHAIRHIPFYEALVNIAYYCGDVLLRTPATRLHRHRSKIIVDLCRVYVAASRNINSRLSAFAALNLDVHYLLPFLSSGSDLFIAAWRVVRENKLPERMLFYLVECPHYVVSEFANPFYRGLSEKDCITYTLCMCKNFHEFKELLAQQWNLSDIAGRLGLEKSVMGQLFKAVKMANYKFHLHKLYDSFGRTKNFLELGASLAELPYLAKYERVADEAITFFLQERKEGVLITNFDAVFELYNAHSQIFRYYLRNFDERDIAKFTFFVNVSPSFLHFCMLHGLSKEHADNLYKYDLHNADPLILERVVRYNIPHRYWLSYLAFFNSYAEGIDYVDSVQFPVGEEYFEVALNYTDFKDIAHAYIGVSGTKTRRSLLELKWLVRFSKTEPLKFNTLFMQNVPFEQLHLFENMNLEELHRYGSGSSGDVVSVDASPKRQARNSTYSRECCYFNFLNADHSIAVACEFLDSPLTTGLLTSAFETFLRHRELEAEEALWDFFSDVEDNGDVRAELRTKLENYRNLLGSRFLFNAKAEMIDKDCIALHPSAFELQFARRHGQVIDLTFAHFINAFGYVRFRIDSSPSFPGKTLVAIEIQNDLSRIKIARGFRAVANVRYGQITTLLESAMVDYAKVIDCDYVAIVPFQFIIDDFPSINSGTAYSVYSSLPSKLGYSLFPMPTELALNESKLKVVWIRKIESPAGSRCIWS